MSLNRRLSRKRREATLASGKVSAYFPKELLLDIDAEARRTDRSLSYLLQLAWKVARPQVSKLPTMNPPGES